jgi:small subunit ribosomal protein S16
MFKIRLKKLGRKGKPFYRIVLMNNLSKRDGKSIAELGFYDPLTKV